jgi:hypothetical protein
MKIISINCIKYIHVLFYEYNNFCIIVYNRYFIVHNKSQYSNIIMSNINELHNKLCY